MTRSSASRYFPKGKKKKRKKKARVHKKFCTRMFTTDFFKISPNRELEVELGGGALA
jgi:hypothetical protein